MGNKVDFFISYTGTDEQWAKWIAGELENKKYTTIIQAWDFKPGTNFVSNMHNALIHCERFIAVISPDYFKSLYCQAEWTAAFTRDPSCEKALFIPVRVKECKPEGLFAPVVYVDLYGIEEQEAVERLLNGLSTDPRNRPGFPGTLNKPKFPGQLPFNNLPFRKNPNFTGRQKILKDIEELFRPGHDNPLTLSFLGLGGVGKTQIVLEYAFRYGHLYDTIWWIDAESSLTIFKAFSSFAHKNRLLNKEANEKDIILEAVRNWMSQHGNWLFIYDNVEDSKTLYEYLPGINRGHILITSRYTNWYRLGEIISIDVFDPEEAESFLIKSTGIDDRKNAAVLTKELGYLPLALDQAAAYIANNKIAYEEYIHLFQNYKIDIFKDDGYKPNDYSSTVAVTWNISVEKINNESSGQLLTICSFFAPDNINRNIFIESSQWLPEPLASEVLDKLKYNRVLSELVNYSLIKFQNNKISIHRLLQEVIGQALNKKKWLKYCLNSMYELFHFDYNNQNTWDKCSELIPHVLSVAEHSYRLSVDEENVASLNNEAASWLNNIALYKEAEPLFKRALDIRMQILGEKHPDTASSLNNLAKLYHNQGRYELAEPLYEIALKIREEVLGAKHPDIASSLNNLALLYRNQGRYEVTEPLFKRALEIREEVLGAKHPDTASSLNNLALLYDDQGKDVEAEPLYKRAIKISKEVLGAKHASTAAYLNNLAKLLDKMGRYEEAEPLFDRAIKIKEEVLGTKHPDTAISLNNLAALYDDQGRYEEAESLYKRALGISEEVLGAKHPSTAAYLNNLAGLYRNQSRYEEAEPLYKRAIEIKEEVLGAKHPGTATSLNNLAKLYHNQGRYELAELLYKKALKIREKVMGAKHPDTAISLNNLAQLYVKQKRHEEAELLLKKLR